MDCDTKGMSLMLNDRPVPPDRGKNMDENCTNNNCRTRPQDRHDDNSIQRRLRINEASSSEKKKKMCKTHLDDVNNKDEEGDDGDFAGFYLVLNYGWVSLCGRRRAMEDAVTIVPGLVKFSSSNSSSDLSKPNYINVCDYFGVYDGHGGSAVAHVCRDRLHQVIAEEIEIEIETETRNADEGTGGEDYLDWEKVMVRGFGRVDEEVREMGVEVESMNSIGSTVVVALVSHERVVVANCGDSRAVMSRAGAAVALSHDHKPDRPDEMERVEAAGGRVVDWYGYRILGVLATSRSIGDQHLKPYVISVPEVIVKERTEEDEFLILASDGMWDVMSNEAACKMVRKCLECARLRDNEHRISTKDDAAESSGGSSCSCSCCTSRSESAPAEAAAMLAELALARGSKDNITIVVVDLNITGLDGL
ncbi:hypothetical protein Sjap_021120 [Stephania japonica]|uniref:protein-serine/threonine phosphatase n=1 Tax=Stephania japonica TaxID=461633 RepID=A0AAP0F209_9MAGN